MFEFVHNLYEKLFARELHRKRKKPSVYFENVKVIDKTPKNEEVGNKEFIIVVYKNKPLWALFRCPCGCRHVITLSLQREHIPNWKVGKSWSNRPTVYPSVWQTKGCLSHFWVEDGRIYWAR
jgi:Family of unknown function (DUF6527)